MTLRELGEQAHLSARHLGEIERGNGNPRLNTILLLMEALDIDVYEFAVLWRAQRNPGDGPR